MMSPLLALVVAAALSPGSVLTVDNSTSLLKYQITHKLHRVKGESNAVEGKAMVKEGQIITMVRVPVASFRSGDGNRDAHMQEALSAEKYPFVVWKGVAPLGADNALSSGMLNMAGRLEFHGVERELSVPLEVESRADGTVRIRGSLAVSLDQFQVARPSLLFMKIDDTCRVDLDFLLKVADAPLAHGSAELKVVKP